MNNINEKTKYKIFVLILMLFLLTFGIFVGLTVSYNSSVSNDLTSYTPDDMEKDIKRLSQNETEQVNTKTYDIEVVYIDNYTLCNESVNTSRIVYDTNLDDLKKKEKQKQEKDNKIYEVKEESNERLVYYRDVNQYCPNHFNVKFEDGKVNIYNVVSQDVNTIYKTIDVSEKLIRPELLEELNKGIKVNSKEELTFIIEDIES